MSLAEDLANLEWMTPAERRAKRAEEKMQAMRDDIRKGLIEYGQDAIRNAEDYGQKAAKVAAVDKSRISEYGVDTSMDKGTPKDVKQAVGEFGAVAERTRQQTGYPALQTAMWFGSPMVAGAAMTPIMLRQLLEIIQSETLAEAGEKATNTALDLLPVVGTVREWQTEEHQAYRQEHPLRALIKAGLDEGDTVASLKVMRDVYSSIKKPTKSNKDAGEGGGGDPTEQQFDKVIETLENPEPKEGDITGDIKTDMSTTLQANKKGKKPSKKSKLEAEEKLQEIQLEEPNIQESKRYGLDWFSGAYGKTIKAAPSNLKELVTLRDILDTANSITPVGIGMLKIRGAFGYKENPTNAVRIDKLKRHETYAHELGHFMDSKMNISGWDDELVKAAESKWGNAYAPEQRRAEGIAEFTAEFAFNPEVAKRNFPNYYQAFVKNLPKHPEFADKFLLMCEQIRRYQEQSSVDKGKSAISWMTKDNKALTPEEQLKRSWDLFYYNMVDDTHLLKTIMEETVGTKLSHMDNPADLAKDMKSQVPARTRMLLGDIKEIDPVKGIQTLSEIYGCDLDPVTYKSIFDGLKKSATEDPLFKKYLEANKFEDPYEAFSVYAVSRHMIEVIHQFNMERMDSLEADMKGLLETLIAKGEELSKFEKENTELKATDPKAYKKAIKAKEGEIARLQKKYTKKETEYNDIKEGRNDPDTPLELEDAVDIVNNAPAALEVAMGKLRLYNRNLLSLQVAGQLLTVDEANYFLKTYPNYIPFNRDFSFEKGYINPNVSARECYVNLSKPYKKMRREGSQRVILDPLNIMFERTQKVISDISKNEVGLAMAAAADSPDGAKIAIKVGASAASAAHNVVKVRKKGKEVFYQIKAEGLYNALTLMDAPESRFSWDCVDRFLKMGAKVLHVGITLNPIFMAANYLKDTAESSVTSKTGINIFKGDFIKAWDLFNDPQLMAEFYASGVPMTTRTMERSTVTSHLKEWTRPDEKNEPANIHWSIQNKEDLVNALKGESPNVFKKAKQGVEWLGDNLEYWANKAEMANRLLEFKNMRDQLRKKGVTSQAELLAKAGTAGRDLTTNYTIGGARGRLINRYVTFFNAAIQGTDKFRRMLRDDPKGTIRKGLYFITLPTMILWMWNFQWDWYRNLSLADRMKYWYFGDSKKPFFRIPKPEGVGYMFGSMSEALASTLILRDDSFKESALQMLNESTPSIIPSAMKPIVEIYLNKNLYTGRAIETLADENKPVEDRYDAYTSTFAKQLGNVTSIMGVSPKQIDHYIKGQGGDWGKTGLMLYDAVASDNERPSSSLWEKIRFSPNTRFSRSADTFYEGLKEAKMNATKNPKKYKGLLAYKRKIDKEYSYFRKKILNNPKLTGDQKRAYEDKMRANIERYQRQANRKYLGIKYIRNVN